MRGVFLDLESLDHNDLDLSPLEASVREWDFRPYTATESIGSAIAEAEVVVSNKAPLTEEALSQAPSLRLICIAATGTNNVDLEAARRRGIVVCNVPDYATPSVVQHVFSLILALTTHLLEYQQTVAEGRWCTSRHFSLFDYPIREIAGKELGIVGYGTLGRAVAQVAEAFGMQVQVAQLPGRSQEGWRVPLDDLLPQVDILSLHCPLTSETRGLLGPVELAQMHPEALLINTARGGLVDEAALADALRRGALGGAGVDVLSQEPPPFEHPLLAGDIPNLLVTPHIAWASQEARQRLVNELVATIHAFRDGEPRNRVD